MSAFTVDGRTLELLQKQVADEIAKTIEIIEFGQPHVVENFAVYQRCVGVISGLRFLEKALEESRTAAEKEAAPTGTTG